MGQKIRRQLAEKILHVFSGVLRAICTSDFRYQIKFETVDDEMSER